MLNSVSGYSNVAYPNLQMASSANSQQNVYEENQVVNTPQKKSIKTEDAILIGAGVIATAAGIVYLVKSGKGAKMIDGIKNLFNKKGSNVVKNLEDINFDKGVATLKEGGEKFTGTLNHTLKSGDKVAMEYIDGVLQKSTKTGQDAFEKVYKVIDGGKNIIEKTVNGNTEVINITEKIENATAKRLQNIIGNSKTLEEAQAGISKLRLLSEDSKQQILDKIQGRLEKEAQNAALSAADAAAPAQKQTVVKKVVNVGKEKGQQALQFGKDKGKKVIGFVQGKGEKAWNFVTTRIHKK